MSCQSFLSCLDVTADNVIKKAPRQGDRLSGKVTQLEHFPADKQTECLRNLTKRKNFP